MARTQAERKAETRRRLLRAAADLFARDGYDAVSVDAVGDAADRTSGSVYAHFGGKSGLLLAVLEEFQHDVGVLVDAESLLRPTLDDRLAGLWHHLTHHPDPAADRFVLLEMELFLHAARDPELAGPLARRYANARTVVAVMLRGWIDEFDLSPGRDDEGLAAAFIGILAGMLLQRLIDPDAIDDDVVVATLAGLLGAHTTT